MCANKSHIQIISKQPMEAADRYRFNSIIRLMVHAFDWFAPNVHWYSISVFDSTWNSWHIHFHADFHIPLRFRTQNEKGRCWHFQCIVFILQATPYTLIGSASKNAMSNLSIYLIRRSLFKISTQTKIQFNEFPRERTLHTQKELFTMFCFGDEIYFMATLWESLCVSVICCKSRSWEPYFQFIWLLIFFKKKIHRVHVIHEKKSFACRLNLWQIHVQPWAKYMRYSMPWMWSTKIFRWRKHASIKISSACADNGWIQYKAINGMEKSGMCYW